MLREISLREKVKSTNKMLEDRGDDYRLDCNIEGFSFSRTTIEEIFTTEIEEFFGEEGFYEFGCIECDGDIIVDLDGIEDFKNLNSIILSNQKICDIDHLRELKDLSYLIIKNNKIEDISPLKDLFDLSKNRESKDNRVVNLDLTGNPLKVSRENIDTIVTLIDRNTNMKLRKTPLEGVDKIIEENINKMEREELIDYVLDSLEKNKLICKKYNVSSLIRELENKDIENKEYWIKIIKDVLKLGEEEYGFNLEGVLLYGLSVELKGNDYRILILIDDKSGFGEEIKNFIKRIRINYEINIYVTDKLDYKYLATLDPTMVFFHKTGIKLGTAEYIKGIYEDNKENMKSFCSFILQEHERHIKNYSSDTYMLNDYINMYKEGKTSWERLCELLTAVELIIKEKYCIREFNKLKKDNKKLSIYDLENKVDCLKEKLYDIDKKEGFNLRRKRKKFMKENN